jgi:predicted MPP superfamily phosphohydrolase
MKKPSARTIGSLAAAIGLSAAALLSPPSVAVARAPVKPGVTVTIAAAGDIARSGSPGKRQKQTADLIRSVIHPALVLMLGDAQYRHGEYAQFLRSYDPTWGAFKDITAPVPGNHEYETKDADGYFRYFADQLDGRGSTATDPHAGYYSFDVGDWHIVALNSNCHFANCGAQATWLRNDVASDDHLCELVMYHDPGQRTFENAAATAKVDLVLTGHLHRYERWDHLHASNLRLLIVGTGGDSAGPPDRHADAGFKGYGVVRLDLGATDYTWKFIEVGGQIRDSGSDSCED